MAGFFGTAPKPKPRAPAAQEVWALCEAPAYRDRPACLSTAYIGDEHRFVCSGRFVYWGGGKKFFSQSLREA